MTISDLNEPDLLSRLRGNGLFWHIGPFVIRGRSSIDSVSRGLSFLYGDFPIADENEIVDTDFVVRRCGLMPTRFNIIVDGKLDFPRVERRMEMPIVEWALNLNSFYGLHRYLAIHAAVVERGGRVAIFPGDPGQGKSTLCAALISRGWRLLSDEVALIDPRDNSIVPVPRPINLKNRSIALIRGFAPSARFGPTWEKTIKGMVSHMLPPPESVARANERAAPGWLIFPAYTAEAEPLLQPLGRAESLVRAGNQALNYEFFGSRGFESLANLLDESDCYEFCYSDLEQAVAALDALTTSSAGISRHESSH